MSKIAEELNTYIKMVSGDNLVKEKQSHQSIHDVLQNHPKEVALFKRSPETFNLEKHPEFYKDLFDLYNNSGEMPHEVVKASSERYKAQWVWDKLHDEISGQDQDEVDPHGETPYDDFDMDLEYNDDNDWGGFDNFESKLMKETTKFELAFDSDQERLVSVMDHITSDDYMNQTGNDYFWKIHANIINDNFDGKDWNWDEAIEHWELEDIDKAIWIYQNEFQQNQNVKPNESIKEDEAPREGDVLNHDELGKVKVLKIVQKGWGGFGKYLIQTSQGNKTVSHDELMGNVLLGSDDVTHAQILPHIKNVKAAIVKHAEEPEEAKEFIDHLDDMMDAGDMDVVDMMQPDYMDTEARDSLIYYFQVSISKDPKLFNNLFPDEDIKEYSSDYSNMFEGEPMLNSKKSLKHLAGIKEEDVTDILARHPEEVQKAKKTGGIEYNSGLWTELFYHYQDDMPYGTQKARDGDPDEFIHQALADDGIMFDESTTEEDQLDEWVPPPLAWAVVVNGLAIAVRVGGAALKFFGRKKVTGTAVNTVVQTTTPLVSKQFIGGVAVTYVWTKYQDFKDWIGNWGLDMDDEDMSAFAKIVVKYGIPAGAVIAILYGGKKLKDYLTKNPEYPGKTGNTTINNYYSQAPEPEPQMASKEIDHLKHLSGI